MDGTLVDSTAVIHRTWKWWAEKHSLPLEPILAVERGRPNREVLQQFGPHLDIEEESRLFIAAEKSDTAGLTVIPGSYEVIRAARQGRWAIVTSAEKSLAEVRLKAAGLAMPEVLITADMIRHGKPDPECYLMAAQHLDVNPGECMVFEDSPSGLLSARNAGMPVIAIGPFVSGHEAATLCIRDFTEVSITSDAQGAFEIRVGKP